MRKIIYASATLLLLSGCNTIDGFGKDMGAIGQSFGGMFDSSMQNSRRIRDNSDYIMGGSGGMPPAMPQQGGYGGQPPMGGGYGGGGMGAMPPQFPPYGQAPQYQQQPRQPAMPYYYNEGY